MNFFHHKDLGNHLLQLCPKVVKHPVYNYRNRIYSIMPNETVPLIQRVIYITDPLAVLLKGSVQLMTRPCTGHDNPVFSKPINQLTHSLEVLTTELLVKELNKMFPSHRILQQFLQTECPALHPPCRNVLPVWTKVNRATSIHHVHQARETILRSIISVPVTNIILQ